MSFTTLGWRKCQHRSESGHTRASRSLRGRHGTVKYRGPRAAAGTVAMVGSLVRASLLMPIFQLG